MKNLKTQLLITIYTFLSLALLGVSGIAVAENAYVSGAFIQLDESNVQQDENWWYEKVAAMEEIGVDTIVIQYAALNEISYFDAESAYYNQSSGNNNPIEHILTKADELDIDVYLGLGLESSFNVTYNNGFEFNYDIVGVIDRAKAILTDLDQMYGYSPESGTIHESLVGWYFPTEFNDANVIRSGHATFRDDIVNYYSTLSLFAHEQTGLETMISPFFASDGAFYGVEKRDPVKYASWWNDILDDDQSNPDDQFIDIDIIAHQDSVGAGHVTIKQANRYFKKLKPILENNGVQLWANNEAFRITNNVFEAAPINGFLKQINETSRFVEKNIFFEFTHYMNGEGNTLFDDYKAYYYQ